MKLKISHSIFWCHTQNWSQLELFTDLQIIFYIFEENQPKLNTRYYEIYFPGNFNINLYENRKYVLDKSSSRNKNLDSFTKTYHEYCTLFSLKQLIKSLVTCSSFSIPDHFLASFPNRVSGSGVNFKFSQLLTIWCHWQSLGKLHSKGHGSSWSSCTN